MIVVVQWACCRSLEEIHHVVRIKSHGGLGCPTRRAAARQPVRLLSVGASLLVYRLTLHEASALSPGPGRPYVCDIPPRFWGGQRDVMRPPLALICLVAAISLALTACTHEQVASGMIEAATVGNPQATHDCLHQDDSNSSCWALLHWSNAQHFCRSALEAAAPKPLRWEDVPLSDDWLKTLAESVPGADLVLRGKGSPAFYEAYWSDRPMGQMGFRGAYDLQSRTGIDTWTPWAYTCVYDTFRYEVVNVSVEPLPDQ